MDIIVSLVLMASLMHGNSGVPVQIPSANQQNQVNSTESTQEVFSMILEANKGSTMILKEGDILVPTDRNALICHYGRDSCRWNKNSNGIVNVPYTISSDYSDIQESLITTAMQDFATLTCVRFIPRTTETDYLQIQSRSGCYSNVGKTGRSQVVSLQSPGCLQKGVIQHELNHALGFYHEQSRSDRDNYVKIIKDNVTPGAETNFNKEETNNLGLEYDYSSVMHYGMYAFSKASGLPTIVPKPDDSVRIGQRYGLSNLDVSKINKLYDCGVCSSVLSSLTGTVMSANYPSNYPANAKCVWLIQAPGYMVFFQFNAFDIPASPDCASGYLTIYDGATRSSPVLLNRACGSIQLSSYMASSNTVLLELVSSSARTGTGFKVSYSTVQYGAILTDPSGNISPPDSQYTSEFVWVIKAPAGNKISLTIYRIDMYSATCSKVYLTVIDGPLTTSPQIGTYCSPNKVPNILSSGNTLLVQFHRDGTVPNATFLAGYSFVKQN